ncbi:MAG: GNAT family N-acetyltransferase [Pseudomonadales bacterium]|nr:GNAT family N-acetyltransferase [Pseudomonadales bacterium]MEC8812468.1 GNAT family N-acetyltransferase [Pseudomonadota bacterium]HAG94193.1 GNAT family N-acetyltransferase [Gammaproteobacteria bacterium]MAQ23290.1 GNAT family N-acetyltransferase [Pseudomonadales bacterium]MBI27626.1 GNAT family N-acetyltransferase [Pseudomonadales bacterium]
MAETTVMSGSASQELEYRVHRDPAALEDIRGLINAAYRGKDDGAGRWTTEQHLVDGERITAQALVQLIQQNDSDLIVGFAGDRPRCCIAVKRLADAVEFGTYAVAPELQGQGCGKALLQYAEAYARDWHHRFQVCVVSQNTALIDFYRRRGYRPSGDRLPYPVGQGVGTPKVAALTLTVLVKERQPAGGGATGAAVVA